MATTVRSPVTEVLAVQLRGAITPLARELRQHGGDVTPTQVSAVGTISRYGPMTLGELAERERVSPPMVTKIVAALEERGLVAKSTDPGDRRICRVELAPGGQEWLAEARARSNAWLADRLATLSAAERSQLAASVPLLERLITT